MQRCVPSFPCTVKAWRLPGCGKAGSERKLIILDEDGAYEPVDSRTGVGFFDRWCSHSILRQQARISEVRMLRCYVSCYA